MEDRLTVLVSGQTIIRQELIANKISEELEIVLAMVTISVFPK